jgi:hypothetical protein
LKEVVNVPKEPPETFSTRPWANPQVQALFGQVLTRTGQKFKDPELMRLGWSHQQVARRPQESQAPQNPPVEPPEVPET